MRYFWTVITLLIALANAQEKALFNLPQHQKDVTIYLKTLLNNATIAVTISSQSFDYWPLERAITSSITRGVLWEIFIDEATPSLFVQKIALLKGVRLYRCRRLPQESFVQIDNRIFHTNLPLIWDDFETKKGWFSPKKEAWKHPTNCQSYINYR